MTTAPPTEARELSLLDKVELKIALSNSDESLQKSLSTYLAPVLLKLASEHLSVRNKVISICQHINTRITPQSIQLPVKALLKQFKDNPNTPLIRHFDLTYIQKGLSRLSNTELAELLPLLTENVARDAAASAVNGSKLFNCLLRSLAVYKLPLKGTPEDTALRTRLAISDIDAEFLSLWFGKVILLRSGSTSGGSPGVSEDEQSFLTLQGRPETWDHLKPDGLNLVETRTRVLTFLASGAFTSQERFLPALFSSADAASRIADLGEDMLKRALPKIDLTDRVLISKLYDIYFSYYTSSDQNASHYVPAVRVPVRTKIISVLSKSQTSTCFPEKVQRLAQTDLVAGDATLSKNDREVLKLRSAVVGFLSFMSRQAAKSDLAAIAQPLIRSLQTFIEQQGEDNRTPDFKTLRGSTYEIIGQLAAANRTVLLQSDLALLRWLFQSLAEETDRDVVVSVDESLSSTMRSFQQDLEETVEVALRQLLTDVMTQESRNARNLQYAAIRFANRCLAYNDVTARYIDLLALATPESSHDMVEEAKKGLDPYWYRLYQTNETLGRESTLDKRSAFPDFAELVKYIFTSARSSQLPANVLAIAVQYARQSVFWAALKATEHTIEVSTEWERKLDLAVSQDQNARTAIRQYLVDLAGSEAERGALATLWQIAVKGMLAEQQATDRAQCARVVVELCVFSPPQIQEDMASFAAELEPAVLANDIELRTLSAQAYGLLSAQQAEPSSGLAASFEGFLKRIEGWETAVGADANKVHGAALALSSYICHRLYAKPDDATAAGLLTKLLPLLLTILDKATDAFLSQASFVSLGMLCQYFVIGVKRIETHLAFSAVLEKIMKWAKAGNEKAINALGYLAMTIDEEEEAEKLKQLTDKIRELHEIRQMETQFAVGEALAAAGCGWESSALLPQLDVDGPPPRGPKRMSMLAPLIDKTLIDSTNTKPSLKKASVVWLLCLIQFCSDRPEVQERLRKFQVAFKRCLSDRDDLVQEASSRGLGLVYEKGGKEIQDELVRDLVGSFSGDRTALAGTVSEDTQLFEAGALPTGEGQSVTTYKDIMSLASEVGDSSLVYRFMSLASNNAIWSSRAAFGRFGLSNVLSGSSVDGYLAANPKLYPKLYRYRFDPNSNVRRSMNDIWNALIKDSNAAINQNFEYIMEDLLTSIVGREWRVRQASCAAVADLVQGRKLDQITPHLDRIWSLCFKVLDDIKESVRAAAAELSRVLIGILLRTLESGDASADTGKTMLKSVLPFLLSTQGLESAAKETQMISIHTLLEIIKKAKGSALRPFIPDLVESLLSLLTSFEGEAVNYIHMNAAKYNLTEQKIDEMRLTNIRGSPLMEAIERCLDLLDEETMKELTTKVQGVMKTAVGMPSKVGCGRVLVSLSTRRNFLFKPYADTFLTLIPRHVSDRNEMVSSSYAASLGYVARSASDEAILKVAKHISKLYFDSDDDRSRIIAGEIVRAVAKHATDRFASLASAFLPLVFTARNDENEDVKQLFKDTWTDNTGGDRAASLYLREIIMLANEHLTSKRWVIKHGAALAVAEAMEALAKARGGGGITEAEAAMVWPALKLALSEKSWDGKEHILTGLSTFVKTASAYCKAHPDVALEIPKVALREAGRRNAKYRPHAITSLGDVAACDGMRDMHDDVVKLLEPVINDLSDGKEDLVEDHAESERLRRQTLASAVTALFSQSLTKTENSPAGLDAAILESRCLLAISLAKKANTVTQPGNTLRIATAKAALSFAKAMLGLPERRGQQKAGHGFGPAVLEALLELVTPPDENSSPALEEERQLRSDTLVILARWLRDCDGSGDAMVAKLTQQLKMSLAGEASQPVRRKLLEALEVVAKLRPST